jgi:pyridoxine kinase
MTSLKHAIQVLHDKYRVPHVVITSVSLGSPDQPSRYLSVVGSSRTSDGRARFFKIAFPSIDCYFSGTGDMFAALMLVRMREAVELVGVNHSDGEKLTSRVSWLSDDQVAAVELPLAKAAERVLASMHELLSRTKEGMGEAIEQARNSFGTELDEEESKRRLHLVRSKAAELKLVRNLDCLRAPTVQFQAKEF